MASVDLTAKGGGYYRVHVNGALFSQHVAEREAVERCTEVLNSAPTADVYYDHAYRVEAKLADDGAAVPDATAPSPQSDGGIDLIDFLTMLDEEANGPLIEGDTVDAPDFYSGIQLLVLQHRDSGSWLFQRLVARYPDGTLQRVGLSWRGYVLLWHMRDRNAIRIGG